MPAFGGFSLALHSFVIPPAHHSAANRWIVSVQEISRDRFKKVSVHRSTICGSARCILATSFQASDNPSASSSYYGAFKKTPRPDTRSRLSPMNFHQKTNDLQKIPKISLSP